MAREAERYFLANNESSVARSLEACAKVRAQKAANQINRQECWAAEVWRSAKVYGKFASTGGGGRGPAAVGLCAVHAVCMDVTYEWTDGRTHRLTDSCDFSAGGGGKKCQSERKLTVCWYTHAHRLAVITAPLVGVVRGETAHSSDFILYTRMGRFRAVSYCENL